MAIAGIHPDVVDVIAVRDGAMSAAVMMPTGSPACAFRTRSAVVPARLFRGAAVDRRHRRQHNVGDGGGGRRRVNR
jgi:hypothetical protein